MRNGKSPYKISTTRANSSAMARRTQAAIFVFSRGLVMEVVGIDKIIFPCNLIFQNSTLFLTGYQHRSLCLPAISIFAGYVFSF
jgi:hypothetical protein